ncbi:MAG: 23S rRNA (uracil(1939)-C(5))-methyltransferase RlmD [Candidatus Kapaibacteriales bacterium]
MKKKEIYITRIESLAFEGKGIGKLDGKVVFVRNAVPKDLAKIQIIKNKENFAEAQLLDILEPSNSRTEPLCKHFGICGGCSFQNLNYTEQLVWKSKFVQDSFKKIAKIESININPPLPSSKIYGYRNKTEFTFGDSRWLIKKEIALSETILNKNFALGFFIPKRYDKILDIEECFLHPFKANAILNLIKNKAIELSVPAYNIRAHTGFLRNVVFRFSRTLNELMVILVITTQIGTKEKEFLDWFKSELPKEKIEHILLAYNDSYSPTANGKMETIKGKNYLFENVLGFNFKISPFSFFQINPFQVDNFAQQVLNYADSKNKIVWDLYCGAGTLTLPLAKFGSLVCGVELNDDSIKDAKENANLNNIDNVEFYKMDLQSRNIIDFLKQLEPPDVVVIDPPRSGIHKNLTDAILKIKPKRIIYVSCNPTTQARDCEIMKEAYTIKEIQPIDMFPQTYHIESIALLEVR